MTKQLSMFGGALETEGTKRSERHQKAVAARPSIDQRFATFHKANPHVLDEMLRLARGRLARGETRIGVKALWEELRVSLDGIAGNGAASAVGTEGPYKLNNDFTALYARTLIRHAPELAAVIETRRRKR